MVMCNEQQADPEQYRFLDYRLDQLEQNLRKGQERLENEYKEQNKQIMQTLTMMQESMGQHNTAIVEVTQRISNIEQKAETLDNIRERTTKHHERIKELERRLDIYKQVLIAVSVTVVGAILVELIRIIH